MRATDLLVEVRDRNLTRVAQIKPEHLDLTATIVYNGVGKWSLRLPAEHAAVGALLTEGSGVIVHGPAGTLFSGPTSTPTVSATLADPRGMVTIDGVTDDTILWRRLAYPTPTSADVTAQIAAYDVRTGRADAVMHAFVSANLGPSAPASRRVNALTFAAVVGLGPTVTKSARFDVLGDLLGEIATAAGLRFRVVQVGATLRFEVTEVTDRSATVRFDLRNGTLSSHEFAQSPPSLTRAIVAGQGQGEERTFVERTTAAGLAAESLWGPFGRVERFLDQRNTDDPTELQQAGDKALAEDGATAVAVKAVASDDLTMLFALDWNVGDAVTVVIDGQEPSSTVTSATLLVGRDGVKVGATIGDVQGFSIADALGKRVTSTEQRVSSLERSAEISTAPALPPGVTMPYAGSAAPAGWLLANGAAVLRATYPELFAVIGTTFGAGNGTTTFNLPNLCGRAVVGLDATQSEFNALGKTGGAKTHLLTGPESGIAQHTHVQNAHKHSVWPKYQIADSGVIGINGNAIVGGAAYTGLPYPGYYNAMPPVDSETVTPTNQNAGPTNASAAHNNLQPFVVLNQIIKV